MLNQPNLPCFYLDSAIGLLATGVYVVTRPVASTFVQGVEVPDPAPIQFQVEAIVNPMSGPELNRLPEGRRASDFREVFAASALNSESDANSADLISIDGINYEVNESQRWNAMGNSWRCIVQRTSRLGPT